MTTILVLGNATVDIIQRVARLPNRGETVLARSLTRCAGGKGFNQAIVAARCGIHTTLVAPVGRDDDARFLAAAAATETQLTTHWHTGDLATDVSVILIADDAENVVISSADCARSLTPHIAAVACGALNAGDILVMQGNLCAATTRAAATAAASRGAIRILNTAPIDWDMRPILANFNIIIANAGEAGDLTGGSPTPGAALRAMGVETAIVTLGAAGAIVSTHAGETRLCAPEVDAVDTAGAGDVFVGALAGMLAQGRALADAASIAVASASLSVQRPGTSPSFPTRDELRSIARQANPFQTNPVSHA